MKERKGETNTLLEILLGNGPATFYKEEESIIPRERQWRYRWRKKDRLKMKKKRQYNYVN